MRGGYVSSVLMKANKELDLSFIDNLQVGGIGF
jgi:hypothetical protein